MLARNEIDPRYQWDFGAIYPSYAAWEDALQVFADAVEELSALLDELAK
ncbi:MAG: hypothetical protein IJP98_00800 [Clostridia bacterium]|nr:hypothetical protein [Clostridia bacterium]